MKTILFLISSAVFAQTINPRAITINADADAAFSAFAARTVDPTLSTDLSGAVDASTGAVRIGIAATVKNGDAIKIDNEVMLVTAKTGRDLTVTRGHLGTTAEAHSQNAFVAVLKYATLVEFARSKAIDAIRELVAKELPSVNADAAAIEATRKTRATAAAVQ
jgi:hypothetical protein